jgi:MFS family permease
VSELEASQIQYTWVAIAYMLTQTAGQPLYGKISDLIGRKVHNFKKSVMLVFKTIVAACALREHVCLLCWFIIEWRIKGKPALSLVWLSLADARTVHHMADFI